MRSSTPDKRNTLYTHSSQLRPELNTVAVGRLGCYLPRASPSVAILSSQEVAKALTQVSIPRSTLRRHALGWVAVCGPLGGYLMQPIKG